MAQIAFDVNRGTQNIGARRLYTIMERVLEKVSFEAPEMTDKHVRVRTRSSCARSTDRHHRRRRPEPVYPLSQ